jgi:hypothetical protein
VPRGRRLERGRPPMGAVATADVAAEGRREAAATRGQSWDGERGARKRRDTRRKGVGVAGAETQMLGRGGAGRRGTRSATVSAESANTSARSTRRGGEETRGARARGVDARRYARGGREGAGAPGREERECERKERDRRGGAGAQRRGTRGHGGAGVGAESAPGVGMDVQDRRTDAIDLVGKAT